MTSLFQLPNPTELVVRAQGIHHAFGTPDRPMPVLFDVDLQIAKGELVIMTGPSGSGKTTLLTLIGALRSAQGGNLQVMGRELVGLSESERVAVRRRLGFIFQSHNLFASLTALQNVRMGLELQCESAREVDQRARQILTDVGLEDRMHHKPEALSGGQRQRVAVARALAGRPPLVLADEPTAALDGESGRRVIELLQRLAGEQGTSTLLVTHDSRVFDAADRMVNMVDGRVVSDVSVGQSIIICEFLMQVPAFSAHTPGALAEIAEKMESRTFLAGDTIFEQGDPGESFFLIHEGAVRIFDPQSHQDLATLGPGDFFGEVALIADQPRNASAIAERQTEAYTLDKAQFRNALERGKSFREQLLEIFSTRR